MKKVVSICLCALMMMSILFGATACNNNAGATDKKVKIGVLVADDTTPEALAFRSYYIDYIQQNYNVEFVYSDQTKDAASEKASIDTFITNNCKAVISFSSFDVAACIEQCIGAKVYYAMASGHPKTEEYEKYKENQYFVGAIGPDMGTEFQVGYEMAKHYLDQGKTKFAIFGGAIHVFRFCSQTY